MNPFLGPISPDDALGFDRLASAVRDWEPRFELYRPPRQALLYEPDGTLYAVCIGAPLSMRADRRVQGVRPGDAVVIPQAYAVDAGAEVDLLALRYDGPPPDHFRERFIQVWGFEHFPAPPDGLSPGVLADVIAGKDARHRVPYAVLDMTPAVGAVEIVSSEVVLLIGLSGSVEVSIGRDETCLSPGALLALAPRQGGQVAGRGRVGVLTVLNEIAHESRTLDPRGLSPEYRPPGPA